MRTRADAVVREEPPEILLVAVGDEWHAVPLDLVREVVPYAIVTPVPDGPRWLDGLVNLRGDVLPVVDTGASLGVPDAGARTHLVVADTAGGPTALVATGTPRTAALGDRVGPGTVAGARARHLSGGDVCTLLDLEQLTGQT